MTKKISEHITYTEATYSPTAEARVIDNTPTAAELANMKFLAAKVFEPLRAASGVPIRITSFFRTAALNQAVGGSRTSDHVLGRAMDLQTMNPELYSNADIFRFIKTNLDFHQLIHEYGSDEEPAWVHVSYKSDGHNDKQVLIKRKGKPYQLFGGK